MIAAPQAAANGTLAGLNRQNYAFPPDHGARLVTMILADPALKADWMAELEDLPEEWRRAFSWIEKVLDENIRPLLQKDGGDLEIVDIKDRVVYVELKGACSDCMGSTNTIKMLVEQALKDRVDERIRVVQV